MLGSGTYKAIDVIANVAAKRGFGGEMDDWTLYNKVLTQAEVLTAMECPLDTNNMDSSVVLFTTTSTSSATCLIWLTATFWVEMKR